MLLLIWQILRLPIISKVFNTSIHSIHSMYSFAFSCLYTAFVSEHLVLTAVWEVFRSSSQKSYIFLVLWYQWFQYVYFLNMKCFKCGEVGGRWVCSQFSIKDSIKPGLRSLLVSFLLLFFLLLRDREEFMNDFVLKMNYLTVLLLHSCRVLYN
jgi:hypothetical protein